MGGWSRSCPHWCWPLFRRAAEPSARCRVTQRTSCRDFRAVLSGVLAALGLPWRRCCCPRYAASFSPGYLVFVFHLHDSCLRYRNRQSRFIVVRMVGQWRLIFSALPSTVCQPRSFYSGRRHGSAENAPRSGASGVQHGFGSTAVPQPVRHCVVRRLRTHALAAVAIQTARWLPTSIVHQYRLRLRRRSHSSFRSSPSQPSVSHRRFIPRRPRSRRPRLQPKPCKPLVQQKEWYHSS